MSNIDNGLDAWESNAKYWDTYMGDHSNFFHCDLVRPYTEEFLNISEDDFVLDIACGNGNFSQRMAEKGAKVVAFDYSSQMISLAKKRRQSMLDFIDFSVCDATNFDALIMLKQERLFNKAVALMAIMDISEIQPLFNAVYEMLCDNGVFVFATHHPCFTYPNEDYFTNCIDKGFAIDGQPELQNYYHRSISDILNTAFNAGFILDRFHEVPFEGKNVPIIMIVRVRKI